MAEPTYRRLTRARNRRKGFLTAFAKRSSLWLGADHLLGVDSSGYTEEYKRFYFRDIQAIILAPSRRRRVWNWVLAIPTALCLLGAIYMVSGPGRELEAIIPWTVLTLVFAIPLAVNNLLGPTCICQIRTAVQTEELPSISRFRRARKILARIRPFIAAAQGQLPPEEIPTRMRQWMDSLAADQAPPPAAAHGLHEH